MILDALRSEKKRYVIIENGTNRKSTVILPKNIIMSGFDEI